MKRRSASSGEDAGAEVIGAILVFGIFITSVALMNVTAVPQAGAAQEDAHWDRVLTELGGLQSGAESAAVPGGAGSTASRSFALAPTVEQGTGFTSFFLATPARAAGELTYDADYGNVTLYHHASGTSGPVLDAGSFTTRLALGRLVFDPHPEFRDPGVMVVENGGIVTTTGSSSTMRFDPAITVIVNGSITNVGVKLRVLNGTTDSVGGYAPVRVSLENTATSLHQPAAANAESTVLRLETAHGSAWGTYLNRTSANAGLTSGTHFTTTVAMGAGEKGLDVVTWTVTGKGSGNDVKLTRGITFFDVRIG